MKVIVISTHALWEVHYGTELELMQNHLDSHDEVVHVVCNGALKQCDANLRYDKHACYKCIDRRLVGKEMLAPQPRTIPFDLIENAELDIDFASDAEVKQITYKSFDVGLAALSSVISGSRSAHLGSDEIDRLKVIIQKGAALYDWMIDLIEKEKPDLVYNFNGRFIYNRAILRACQAKNVTVNIHERGHDIHHYELYKNTLPHDLDYIESRIAEAWNASPQSTSDKEGVAKLFYEERRGGIEQSWLSFIKKQESDRLPSNWDSTRRNIVFFNSSEDEFASIGAQWKRYVYDSQFLAVERVCKNYLSQPEFQFFLRIHPNLSEVGDYGLEDLLSQALPNLTVIYPDGPESTYAMIDRAEKVISFGSTVGIEAAYAGTPSILLGSSFYRNLGSTYNPLTEEELFRLIGGELSPLPAAGALQYGFYMKTFGKPFQWFEPNGIMQGQFKGRKLSQINSSPFILKCLRYLPGNRVFVRILNRVLA